MHTLINVSHVYIYTYIHVQMHPTYECTYVSNFNILCKLHTEIAASIYIFADLRVLLLPSGKGGHQNCVLLDGNVISVFGFHF